MGGWLDGYREEPPDDDYLDDDLPPPIGVILTCHHCGSPRVHPRSTDPSTDAVKFVCAACNRHSTHHLPYGYARCYRALPAPEAP